MRLRTATLAVAGLTLLGLALRLLGVDQALFGDEMFSYQVALAGSPGSAVKLVSGPLEISPPLYFLVAWVLRRVFDTPESIRFISLAASTLTIPLVYALGLRTVGRTAALIAAGLTALSPFAIFFGVEGRPYALMVLLATASTYALLRAADEDRRAWWVAFALLSAAAMYAHYTSAFVLVAQAAWALVALPRHRREVLLAMGAAVVLFLPWVPSLLDDRGAFAQVIIGLLAPLTLENVVKGIGRWVAGTPFSDLGELPGPAGWLLIAAGLAVAAVDVLWRRSLRIPRPPARLTLVLLLAAAAPVGTLLYSLVGDDFFIARNLLVSQPGLYLAFGALLAAPPVRVAAVAVALTAAGFALGAVRVNESRFERPPYDDAAAYLDRAATAQQPVYDVSNLEYPAAPGRVLQTYFERPHALLHSQTKGDDQRAAAAGERTGRLYVVERGARSSGTIPNSAFRFTPPPARFRLVGRREWPAIYGLRVSVYAPR